MPTNTSIHIDRALTNMSVAFIQEQSAFVADQVFPVVPVQKQSDRYFVYNKDDWFRDEAQLRAPATESAGGDYDVDNTPSYFANKYAFHKDVTEDDRTNSDDPLKPDEDAMQFVTQKMLIKREVLWANKFFKPGVWGLEEGGVSTGATAGTSFIKWSDYSSSNPVKDVRFQKTRIAGRTGFDPNVLVLGYDVYNTLLDHPLILDRIKYTERALTTQISNILAGLFDVEKVVVAKSVINTAPKGKTAETDFIMGGSALLAYAAPNPGIKKPSAGYIFAWNGLMGAGAFGNRIVRFPMQQLGIGTERIEGEMAFDCKAVAADMGAFFQDAI